MLQYDHLLEYLALPNESSLSRTTSFVILSTLSNNRDFSWRSLCGLNAQMLLIIPFLQHFSNTRSVPAQLRLHSLLNNFQLRQLSTQALINFCRRRISVSRVFKFTQILLQKSTSNAKFSVLMSSSMRTLPFCSLHGYFSGCLAILTIKYRICLAPIKLYFVNARGYGDVYTYVSCPAHLMAVYVYHA